MQDLILAVIIFLCITIFDRYVAMIETYFSFSIVCIFAFLVTSLLWLCLLFLFSLIGVSPSAACVYCRAPGSTWALEMAKHNLVRNYFLVGVTEELEDFVAMLEYSLPRLFRGALDLYVSGGMMLQFRIRKVAFVMTFFWILFLGHSFGIIVFSLKLLACFI